MTGTKKIIIIPIALIICFFAFIIADWFRFTMWGQIDPRRGVYGNPHLEIWIDINARMPAPARQWACGVLRTREKQILGGVNTLPFYSCQPDFGLYPKAASKAEATIHAISHGAFASAIRRGAATEQQKPLLISCIADKLEKVMTPEQRNALNDNKPGSDILVKLNADSQTATQECLTTIPR